MFQIQISTTTRTYEFNLLIDKEEKSGFKVLTEDKALLLEINELLQAAITTGSLDLKTLEARLKPLIPDTLSVKIQGIASAKVSRKAPIDSLPQGIIGRKIQERLQTTRPKGAGAMVMVSQPGIDPIFECTGTCSVDGPKINENTASLIGSGAKLFTALCSLSLINKKTRNVKTGKPLTLNTLISDVFSEKQMTIFDDPAKASKVTLGMLLSHTSGLVYFADDNKDRRGQRLTKIIDEKTPGSVVFYGHPGDKMYSYSNHIGLVAAMIEIACDKPYESVLKEMLLEPLGMERTSYQMPKTNVLLCYQYDKTKPTSIAQEVTDPMMQGAGGLWTCMRDVTRLGQAFGTAISKDTDMMSKSGDVVISKQLLVTMNSPQAINAPCGLATVLEGDLIGKGGGFIGYDFKFKVDKTTGNSVSMMCNHAGIGNKKDFKHYTDTTNIVLKGLNPGLKLPLQRKESIPSSRFSPLPIEECTLHFSGFSGLVSFGSERPLERINFNGSTLPLQQLPLEPQDEESTDLREQYIITGDSPFKGRKFNIYQTNEHLYACISNTQRVEVFTFSKIEGSSPYPTVKIQDLIANFSSSSGNYADTSVGGPPPYQVRLDAEVGLTLSFPELLPSKCLITKYSQNEISFRACLGAGPQCISYKLSKDKVGGNWYFSVLNGETNDLICKLRKS